MKLDVLITTAHPDDAEFAMGGTILKLLSQGKKVGIADFTRGELGTRGSAVIRDAESAEADKRLGLSARVNLQFRDGFFAHDENHVLDVIKIIRRFQPDILFTNPPQDRHSDHGKAHDVVREAAFLSGLMKIETEDNGVKQAAWRPKRVFHYIQSHPHEPQFIVDISEFWEQKIHVLHAYESQFQKKEGCTEPDTVMTHRDFWAYVEARARTLGRRIESSFAEGFLSPLPLRIDDLSSLI